MFRIQYLLLIAAAALCSCATERTVATNFQPRQRPDSEKTDAELMDALDGIKSFTDDKLETPDFIARAKGVNTHSWQDASKQYATQQSDFHGRSWKEADKRFDRTVNRDIEAKRQSFGQPTIMSARQAQAHTIQETREMMGRTD